MVASSYVLGWVAAEVAGGAVEVRVSDDAEAVEDAALAVVVGGGFQDEAEAAAARRDGLTVTILDEVDAPPGRPRVWLDPRLMDEVVVAVTEAVASTVDDGEAAAARLRGAELEEQVGLLDADMEDALAACDRTRPLAAPVGAAPLLHRFGLVAAPSGTPADLDLLDDRPDEGDYLDAMRRNLDALRAALGCA